MTDRAVDADASPLRAYWTREGPDAPCVVVLTAIERHDAEARALQAHLDAMPADAPLRPNYERAIERLEDLSARRFCQLLNLAGHGRDLSFIEDGVRAGLPGAWGGEADGG